MHIHIYNTSPKIKLTHLFFSLAYFSMFLPLIQSQMFLSIYRDISGNTNALAPCPFHCLIPPSPRICTLGPHSS